MEPRSLNSTRNSGRDYLEIGAALLIVVGALLALSRLDLLPRGFDAAETMSYGLVVVVGLVASLSSCIALTGGLLVAVAARYNEATPDLTPAQRFKPHLYFNAGRIASYTLLGGAIGVLGSVLTFSPATYGVLTLLASAVMILLGLQMLNLLPSLTRFLPTMPKSLGHRIHDLAERDAKGGAFVLGAATFFLPCGFTQALQLYVLAKGSFVAGALTMLAFSLGTLPALLSLSAVSSLASGALQRHFLKFAGVAVVVLGIANIQYSIVLTGIDMNSASTAVTAENPAQGEAVTISEPSGKQIVVMRIDGFDYQPNRFTVKQGVPVEWRIDASEAAACGRILISPALGISKVLSAKSTTTISFVPKVAGEFAFNCGMGMMTPGSKFIVVPNV